MNRTGELLTAGINQFVMQILPVQLTRETRIVTFVFVTVVLKGTALCAETSMNAVIEQTDVARTRIALTRKALTPVAAIQVFMETGCHVVI